MNIEPGELSPILSRRFMPPHVICVGGACIAHA